MPVLREPALVLRAPLLARFRVDRRRAAVLLNHHPVGADVDAPGVGIARHDRDAGADVAAAVVLVPPRRRETSKGRRPDPATTFSRIGSGLDELRLEARRGGFPLKRLPAQRLHQPRRIEVLVEPERHCHAACVAHRSGEHAVAGRIADDVVEQQRRGRLAAVVDLGDRADLQVPVRARDVLQLAQALDARDPGAQVGRTAHPYTARDTETRAQPATQSWLDPRECRPRQFASTA